MAIPHVSKQAKNMFDTVGLYSSCETVSMHSLVHLPFPIPLLILCGKRGYAARLTCVLPVYSAIGQIKLFAAPQIMMTHLRRFVSMDRLSEIDTATALHKPCEEDKEKFN